MTTALALYGICDAGFLRVRDALSENFNEHGEVGASLAVVVDGRMVVDLWAGHADAARDAALGARYDRQRVVDDEGNRGDVRASSRRSGASRPGRAGRELLARIRAGGEVGDSRPLSALASGRPSGDPQAAGRSGPPTIGK